MRRDFFGLSSHKSRLIWVMGRELSDKQLHIPLLTGVLLAARPYQAGRRVPSA